MAALTTSSISWSSNSTNVNVFAEEDGQSQLSEVVVFLDSFDDTERWSEDRRCEDSNRCNEAGLVTRTSECFEGVVASELARPGVERARSVSAKSRRLRGASRSPNGPKIERETTHGIVRWKRVASMA